MPYASSVQLLSHNKGPIPFKTKWLKRRIKKCELWSKSFMGHSFKNNLVDFLVVLAIVECVYVLGFFLILALFTL